VKNGLNLKNFGAVVLLGAGMIVAGCKSAPELTVDQAQKLLQAKFDQAPPESFDISVNDQGMGTGVLAKYWVGIKRYPNGYWADFKLTPDGKKVVTLPGGGDVIQWRPTIPKDPNYSVIVTTVQKNHPLVRDVKDITDETIAGASAAKSAIFSEVVNLEGVPDSLQGIAHNPGNKLSDKHTADFVWDGTAWTLKTIR